MSSFFDESSLCLIPSGYKNGTLYSVKPTDGAGDLTFTRASSATRVGPDGLIEKVRTNLLTYSNDFSNAAWTKVGGTTLTAGQADYLGGTNAWKWEATGTGTIQLAQNPAGATIRTASIYAKAGSVSTLNLWIGSAVTFNLSTGTVTSGTGVITSVGNGWYRCSALGTGVSHNPYFASATAGDYVLISFAQMDEGDIATQYLATTTAPVSTGPVSGLPRLDYLNSSCPRLLLEPQRSNLCLWSENFDNAGWGKTTATVTANTTSAPDGTISADTFDATNNFAFVSQAPTLASGTATTYSVFIKNIDAPYVNLQVRTTVTAGLARFDFTGSTLTSTTLTTGTSSSFTDYGNGWYRCVLACTTSEANQQFRIQVPSTGNSVFVWGAQVEAGAYATSYIPTLSTSVTRVADAASKTGISSLLGGTQGTWFLEMKYQPISSSTVSTMFVTGTSTIGLASTGVNTLRVRINAVNDIIGSVNPTIRHKIAISFNATGVVCFFNGNQITLPNGASQVVSGLDSLNLETGTRHNDIDIYQMLYFPTSLTNSQLAELTAL